MSNVVIIGASHAAAEAISNLRRGGWQGDITLIGEEDSLPYQRPPLSKAYFSQDVSAEKLLIKNEAFYEKAEVRVLMPCRAISIYRASKTVVLDNGEYVQYSKLILATGTRARKLAVEGGDLPNVKYLRTKDDVDRIKETLAAGAKLLVIGAGYIGLELAASAVKQSIATTVLEVQDRVLERVTSPVVSEFYQALHAEHGVDIRLSTGLKRFFEEDGKTYGELEDGEHIEFDCAVVGIGVIPNVELAEEAGLACENGILVNLFTQTDDPDIYAVGDCSNHLNKFYGEMVRLESVPNAMGQAKTAALSICGEDEEYNQLPWFWSDQYDVKLQTAGLMQGYDELSVDGNVEDKKFTVSYFKEHRLIAMDAINSPAAFMKAKKAIFNS